eukprot:7664567-Pyramimonas_sp.AAC.1
MRTAPLGPSVDLSVEPRNVRGVLTWAQRHHANCATGAFGGTKYMRNVPKWERRKHANCATGASGGPPCGATKREGYAELDATPPCELRHWGLRRSCGATRRVRDVPTWLPCGRQ